MALKQQIHSEYRRQNTEKELTMKGTCTAKLKCYCQIQCFENILVNKNKFNATDIKKVNE